MFAHKKIFIRFLKYQLNKLQVNCFNKQKTLYDTIKILKVEFIHNGVSFGVILNQKHSQISLKINTMIAHLLSGSHNFALL